MSSLQLVLSSILDPRYVRLILSSILYSMFLFDLIICSISVGERCVSVMYEV